MDLCFSKKKKAGVGEKRGKPRLCPGHCILQNELPRGTSSLLMPAGKREIGQGSSPSFQLGLTSVKMSLSSQQQKAVSEASERTEGSLSKTLETVTEPYISLLLPANCI